MAVVLLAVVLLVAPPTWHGAQARLTVTYPAGWHVTTRSLTPITDPVERFALYSGPLPRPQGPPRAQQVEAVVLEQEPPLPIDLAGFPQRPRHFHVSRLGMLEGFNGKRWGELRFRDHHRAFYVFVGVGSDARAQLPRLLAALDSLRVGP
jgi:hypothetical protein